MKNSALPPHWCSHTAKGSACPCRGGKGWWRRKQLLREVDWCSHEEWRAGVSKGVTGKTPTPNLLTPGPSKTSSHTSQPLCHSAHAEPCGTHTAQTHGLCLSLQPAVLVLPCSGARASPKTPIWQLGLKSGLQQQESAYLIAVIQGLIPACALGRWPCFLHSGSCVSICPYLPWLAPRRGHLCRSACLCPCEGCSELPWAAPAAPCALCTHHGCVSSGEGCP